MGQDNIWNHFQNQAVFDGFVSSMPRYRFIAKYADRGSKVLNIGVGRGGLERILLEKGVDVFSLDPSDASIEGIRVLLNSENRAKVGYSQNIPYPDNLFDLVIMTEVLEHLEDGVLSATLSEVRRVLRPGGAFVGTVPANENLAANEAICPGCKGVFHRWGHVQSFSAEGFEKLLKKYEFIKIEVELRAFPDWSRRSVGGFIKSAIRYVLGRFGAGISQPNIFFLANK